MSTAAHQLPAAPSPAAGRNSEEAVRKGSQAVSSGQTPASPTVPLGEAGPHSSDADAVGAPASEGPRWAPVDSGTGDLLDLLASQHPFQQQDDQWGHFVSVLQYVARTNGGVIDQNLTRPRLHGVVAPRRIGPMFRRACREGLIRPNEGHTITANSQSGNVGRPARSYDWLGAAS